MTLVHSPMAASLFLTRAEWGTIKVSDPGIIPERCYRLETVAGTAEESQVVESKEAVTWKWGDVANGQGQPQGDGLVDVSDVLCAIDSFGNLANCAAADQQPCTQIDGAANLDDLLTVMSAFTGESFAVTCAAAYPPCNEPTPTVPTRNPYYFTGQRLDLDLKTTTGEPEVVLYHYRARAYDPIHGRFGQRDPEAYADGMYLYEYVRSIPTVFMDPFGAQAVSGPLAEHAWQMYANTFAPPQFIGTISVQVEDCASTASVTIVAGLYLDRTGNLRLQYANEAAQYLGRFDEAAKIARAELRTKFQELQTRFGQEFGRAWGPSGRRANPGLTNQRLNKIARAMKGTGRCLWIIGLTIDAVAIIQAPDGQRGRIIAKTVGGTAGAATAGAVGVSVGAEVGAMCGSIAGPIGAVVGGIGGAIVGTYAGEIVAETVYDAVERNPNGGAHDGLTGNPHERAWP